MRLDYTEKPLPGTQPRFVGRIALVPDLDLGAFACSAVIDWLDVLVVLERQTQFWWVQSTIGPVDGRTLYVEPIDDPVVGPTGTLFRIRFQEPQMARVRAAINATDKKFGLAKAPVLIAIEISVDFTPKEPSEEMRRKLMGVLVRHHFPGRDMLTNAADRPRFSWGTGVSKTAFVLPLRATKNLKINSHLLLSNENDKPAYVDATFYVGERDGPVMWRVMDKVIDTQNLPIGEFVQLDDNRKRVRVEVTLNSVELHKLGIKWFDDLTDANFLKLRGSFFRFMLPTFDAQPANLAAKFMNPRRRTKFLNTGVLGLQAMDEALHRDRKGHRSDLRAALAKKKLTIKPEPKIGVGASGTLVAYPILNKKIETALRHLGERVRRG